MCELLAEQHECHGPLQDGRNRGSNPYELVFRAKTPKNVVNRVGLEPTTR